MCLSSTSLAEAPPETKATLATNPAVANTTGGELGKNTGTNAATAPPAATSIPSIPATPASSGRPNLADQISPRKVPLGLCDGN